MEAKDVLRFNAKINRGAGCWVWTAARFSNGYGAFQVGGKAKRAHRVAYEIAHGPIQKGMFVCHTCDNPACVNPGHLFVGDAKANNDDMRTKGRARYPGPSAPPRGDAHHRARLTTEQVGEIRRRLGGERQKALADEFGVSRQTISAVACGVAWRHVETRPC